MSDYHACLRRRALHPLQMPAYRNAEIRLGKAGHQQEEPWGCWGWEGDALPLSASFLGVVVPVPGRSEHSASVHTWLLWCWEEPLHTQIKNHRVIKGHQDPQVQPHPTMPTDCVPRCHIYPKKSRTPVGEDISGLGAALLCSNSTGKTKTVQSSQFVVRYGSEPQLPSVADAPAPSML